MLKRPHIRRRSIWEYVQFAAPNLLHFVSSNDDFDSVPGLIEVEHLPKLLLFAVHDVRTQEAADECVQTYASAIDSIRGKLDFSIRHGLLNVYENGSFMRVSSSDLAVDKGRYLVRFDDLEYWCSNEGIEISSTLPHDNKGEGGVTASEPAGAVADKAPQHGKGQFEEKSLSTRERENLLKLVIGMAIKGYKYDPAAAKSPIPKEVADDLSSLGISLSDDTVRKYLKQAASTVLPAGSGHE